MCQEMYFSHLIDKTNLNIDITNFEHDSEIALCGIYQMHWQKSVDTLQILENL